MIAKPVAEGTYWIVKNGELKVGSVVAGSDGFDVVIDGVKSNFKTITSINEKIPVDFLPPFQKSEVRNEVSGFATDVFPFNGVYDLKKKLPIFTKDETSKCWYAAGWYLLTQKSEEWVFCPKVIYLQRYPYKGPFKEKGA